MTTSQIHVPTTFFASCTNPSTVVLGEKTLDRPLRGSFGDDDFEEVTPTRTPVKKVAVSSPQDNTGSEPQQQKDMGSEASLTWQYRDPQGNVQGPFSALEMGGWYDAGYFGPELMVKRQDHPTFVYLRTLLKKGGSPFVSTSEPKISGSKLHDSTYMDEQEESESEEYEANTFHEPKIQENDEELQVEHAPPASIPIAAPAALQPASPAVSSPIPMPVSQAHQRKSSLVSSTGTPAPIPAASVSIPAHSIGLGHGIVSDPAEFESSKPQPRRVSVDPNTSRLSISGSGSGISLAPSGGPALSALSGKPRVCYHIFFSNILRGGSVNRKIWFATSSSPASPTSQSIPTNYCPSISWTVSPNGSPFSSFTTTNAPTAFPSRVASPQIRRHVSTRSSRCISFSACRIFSRHGSNVCWMARSRAHATPTPPSR